MTTCTHRRAEYSDTLKCRVCGACGAILPAKGNKFHARAVTVGGERFDSMGEYQRWLDLQAMQSAGLICGLKRQVRFPITVDGFHITDYVADATYIEGGVAIVEDFKGKPTVTQLYRLKKKLLRAIYGIEIREVMAR